MNKNEGGDEFPPKLRPRITKLVWGRARRRLDHRRMSRGAWSLSLLSLLLLILFIFHYSILKATVDCFVDASNERTPWHSDRATQDGDTRTSIAHKFGSTGSSWGGHSARRPWLIQQYRSDSNIVRCAIEGGTKRKQITAVKRTHVPLNHFLLPSVRYTRRHFRNLLAELSIDKQKSTSIVLVSKLLEVSIDIPLFLNVKPHRKEI